MVTFSVCDSQMMDEYFIACGVNILGVVQVHDSGMSSSSSLMIALWVCDRFITEGLVFHRLSW